MKYGRSWGDVDAKTAGLVQSDSLEGFQVGWAEVEDGVETRVMEVTRCRGAGETEGGDEGCWEVGGSGWGSGVGPIQLIGEAVKTLPGCSRGYIAQLT